MRAMGIRSFGGPDVLQPIVVPRPVPLPSEILVRVHAAGINPVDTRTREGFPTPAAAALGSAPHILGWDVSGVVEAVGHGVFLFEPGDEVYGLPWFPRPAGAYAEFVTAPSRQFARKPKSLSHVEAASVPLACLTAWQALVDAADVQPNQRVLIHAAAGGVGQFAVQIAKFLGAHVVATARKTHHEWLIELGADEVIDYTADSFEDETQDIDVVIDLVGDAADMTTVRSLKVLRRDGLLVLIAPGVSPELESAARAAHVRVTPPILVEPDGRTLSRLAGLFETGNLRVRVSTVFPLGEAARAHQLAESGGGIGKVVLEVAS